MKIKHLPFLCSSSLNGAFFQGKHCFFYHLDSGQLTLPLLMFWFVSSSYFMSLKSLPLTWDSQVFLVSFQIPKCASILTTFTYCLLHFLAFHAFLHHSQSLGCCVPQLWDGELKPEASVTPLITTVLLWSRKGAGEQGSGETRMLLLYFPCLLFYTLSFRDAGAKRPERGMSPVWIPLPISTSAHDSAKCPRLQLVTKAVVSISGESWIHTVSARCSSPLSCSLVFLLSPSRVEIELPVGPVRVHIRSASSVCGAAPAAQRPPAEPGTILSPSGMTPCAATCQMFPPLCLSFVTVNECFGLCLYFLCVLRASVCAHLSLATKFRWPQPAEFSLLLIPCIFFCLHSVI